MLQSARSRAATRGAGRLVCGAGPGACGTGRFATFIRDNHPSAEVTCVDLSPFYLAAARENDAYWRKSRFPHTEARPRAASR